MLLSPGSQNIPMQIRFSAAKNDGLFYSVFGDNKELVYIGDIHISSTTARTPLFYRGFNVVDVVIDNGGTVL
jgi:hypothetical protein